MNKMIRRVIGLCLFLFPLWAFSQADSLQSSRRSADSAHYTDTVRYHFSYSGTGSINHTNALSSYVFSNSLQFSAAASFRLYKRLNFTAAFLYNKFTRTRSENTLMTFGLTIVK